MGPMGNMGGDHGGGMGMPMMSPRGMRGMDDSGFPIH